MNRVLVENSDIWLLCTWNFIKDKIALLLIILTQIISLSRNMTSCSLGILQLRVLECRVVCFMYE